MSLLVRQFLEDSAAHLPEKVALVCNGARFTYARLEEMANRLANAFVSHGVKRGDRVAIYLRNSVETVVGIFAALKAGGVFVVINRSTKEDKLLYILDNCRAAVLLADQRALDDGMRSRIASGADFLQAIFVCGVCGETGVSLPDRCYAYDRVLEQSSPQRPANANIDLDLACLVYTSGTTGEPKGVMSDHSNITFAACSIIKYLENTENDIVINVLPLSFDYGLYQLFMTFRFGGTLVLEDGFAFPATVLNRVQQEKVTGLPGVPTLFAMLLRMDLSPFDLSSLRYMTNTAAALPPGHIDELRAKFPRVALYSMYGLTETKRTLYLPPKWLNEKPGSVGIAIPGTEVWIEDEAGNHVGPGVIGELVVRGRHVMRGYWDAPDETARRFRSGPLPGERVCYTGDLFRMDEDGCLFFVGRKDDIIKTRGEKVAPKEIENVLYSLKGVSEAAVVGVPDAVLGQAVKVFLVAKERGLKTEAVLAHCRAHLEDFMMPKYVEFRDSLPKTPSGKIKKTDLN